MILAICLPSLSLNARVRIVRKKTWKQLVLFLMIKRNFKQNSCFCQSGCDPIDCWISKDKQTYCVCFRPDPNRETRKHECQKLIEPILSVGTRKRANQTGTWWNEDGSMGNGHHKPIVTMLHAYKSRNRWLFANVSLLSTDVILQNSSDI